MATFRPATRRTKDQRPAALARLTALLWAAIVLGGATGCGIDWAHPAPLSAVPGFTLSDLQEIQNDRALTQDQKRERIREAVGAPDDEAGDRLVNFLLAYDVP